MGGGTQQLLGIGFASAAREEDLHGAHFRHQDTACGPVSMRPSASLPTGERQLHPVVLADQLERDSLRVSELSRQIPRVDRVHGSVLELVLKVCQSWPAGLAPGIAK